MYVTRSSITSTNATTPPPQTPNHRSLLVSSPPSDAELRSSNAALNLMLQAQNVLDSPTRKYISRLTRTAETLRTQNTLLLRELQDTQSVLSARRTNKRGKRVALKGVIVMSTQEIQSAVLQIENETQNNMGKGRTRQVDQDSIIEEIEEDLLIDDLSDSELGTLSCIIVDN
ncbi:hypothetical protein V500_00614 [Pseudogymnoascus sp. VKM F-4518 (FW-2643)]|nr:hypothetical protein V500_00614 [Pseudogymnoascus sp. VKM F-4518 (FW-2643)]